MLLLPQLEEQGEQPLYVQLYSHIKQEIVTGRLQVKARIPSVRKLAELLSISTAPVEMAYHQLVAEGFIESKPKSGYFVQNLSDPYIQLGNSLQSSLDSRMERSFPARDTTNYRYDYHLSKNDFTHFPFKVWRKLMNQVVAEEQKDQLFYGDPQGEKGLREEIARYLHQFRGVVCSPDQIVIGAGSHVLLTFLCLMLRPQFSQIGIENPGYPLITTMFRQHGFGVVPIALEEDGIDLGELYQSDVQTVYVTPSHQFPRGMLMPVSKRL